VKHVKEQENDGPQRKRKQLGKQIKEATKIKSDNSIQKEKRPLTRK